MAERKGAGALTLVCNICKSSFMSNQSRVQLMEHVSSKHDKKTFEECFPGYTAPS
jgi:hypothetical protein